MSLKKPPQRGILGGFFFFFEKLVRVIGLEPTRLTTPDPKSGAATNYATRATLLLVSGCKDKQYFLSTKDF